MRRPSQLSAGLIGCVILAAVAANVRAATPTERPLTHSLPRGMALWTLQGDLTLVSRREALQGSGTFIERRSSIRIWFEPYVGFRLEFDSADAQGKRAWRAGNDGQTLWAYDVTGNRYTMQPSWPGLEDPRLLLDVGTGGSTDLNSAIAALEGLRLPGLSVTSEETDIVIGRPTQIVLMAPFVCSRSGSVAAVSTAVGISAASAASTPGSGTGVVPTASSTPTPAATVIPAGTPTVRCEGSARYWLDTETGWPLRVEGDDGHGGGFTLETDDAIFDAPIDPSLFQFTPPPGSVQVPVFEN